MTEEQITEETEVDETEEQEAGVTPVPPEPTDDTEPEQEPETKGGNGEAAKYRVQRNEARAERDALQARLEALQAAEVSRLATGPGKLHDGQDLLLTAKLTDLLDDEGGVDSDKVTEAVTALAEKKPHLARPAFDDSVGIGEKGSPQAASWADVISG